MDDNHKRTQNKYNSVYICDVRISCLALYEVQMLNIYIFLSVEADEMLFFFIFVLAALDL